RGRMSDHPALELATLALGQTAPDPEALVVLEGVLQAFGAHLAGDAHLLGLTGGAALLGEERLRVGLRAQRALLPGQLGLVGVLPGDVEQGQLCTRVVVDPVLVHRHRSFHCCVDHRCVDHRRLVGPKVHRCSYGPSSGVGASPCTSRPSPMPIVPVSTPREAPVSAVPPPAQAAPDVPRTPLAGVTVLPVTGLAEIREGDDLAVLLAEALAPLAPQDGDVLCVSTKIVSKALGLRVPAERRDRAVADLAVRTVARRLHTRVVTSGVQIPSAPGMAAGGADSSNAPQGP